jgi:hypothetical protein
MLITILHILEVDVGCLSNQTFFHNREFIHEGHHRTVHELADTVGISYGVCQMLTENLNVRHIATKFVPQPFTNDQKQQHVNVYLELRE